ncbi:hypothetical protein EDD18DRAFT_1107170 [Armillaria luteobubalina]|uniref:DUF5648 domain-containing protein n=1 Tax=Armillaria luteobubalina TaxID=153913 RepID=A0AA39Q3H5_9AGAR|nr:hypothetical protein EDD18DRAFT_1107170 [Armillaria luteobubalina]
MKAILSLFVVALLSLSAKAASVNIAPEARAADACPDLSTGIPLLRARYLLSVVGTRYYTTNTTLMNQLVNSALWQPEGTAGIVFKSASVSTVPLYAFLHAGTTSAPRDWYYTASASDKAIWDKNKNYAYQGISGHMFSNAACGGVPFYTFWDPVHQVHFFTADKKERKRATSAKGGYIDNGIAGYILPL